MSPGSRWERHRLSIQKEEAPCPPARDMAQGQRRTKEGCASLGTQELEAGSSSRLYKEAPCHLCSFHVKCPGVWWTKTQSVHTGATWVKLEKSPVLPDARRLLCCLWLSNLNCILGQLPTMPISKREATSRGKYLPPELGTEPRASAGHTPSPDFHFETGLR